ncbi:hypothetical protein ANCCAN_16288 [Ancylostoma caninum]|uniref:Uncharacterized protein n=1 Tax=Ancylostoma caninum TaxID=29170 RepID=A0A368G020_ANCCA|nr:hypothetical protein ANCCAN_16288 [Ancylostoma caninum]
MKLHNTVFNLFQLIKEHIQNVKTGELNGCQLRFELPRNQQKSIPKLFAQLENERESLRIESFGLSVNALEEAFLKVADLEETSSHQGEEDVFQDASTLELHEGMKLLSFIVFHNFFSLYKAWNSHLIPFSIISFHFTFRTSRKSFATAQIYLAQTIYRFDTQHFSHRKSGMRC